MNELTHGFLIVPEKCDGCMACMRACPTRAIRVKKGKATVIPELCIDCGSCLGVCATGAITATTITFADLDKFKLKVAVASPALFTQFANTPAQVGQALLALGFDAVWKYAVDIELIDRAIRDYVKKWSGPFPLISHSCPVAAPVAGGGSPLAGALGLSQIYNDLLSIMRKTPAAAEPAKRENGSGEWFLSGAPEGEFPNLSREHYLPLQGLSDIIRVFDDVEKGKIRNVEFLECHACQGACISGNLTVENLYVARSKNLRLVAGRSEPSPEFLGEVDRRFAAEDFSLRAPLPPRNTAGKDVDLRERVERKKRAAGLLKALPLLNCGLV